MSASALESLGDDTAIDCHECGKISDNTNDNFFCIEKRIVNYCKENIRAPSLHQVVQWGKKLGINPADVRAVSDRVPYRHALGKSASLPDLIINFFLACPFFPAKDRARAPCQILNGGKKLCPPAFEAPLWPRGI